MMLSDEPERTEDAPLPLATAREMLALAARLRGMPQTFGTKRERWRTVQYTVISNAPNKVRARLAYAPNAARALAIIEVHQAAGEVVGSIRSHQEGEIGIEVLRILAKEEAEELAG